MNMDDMATSLGLESGEFYELVEVFVETTSSDLAKLESALMDNETQQVVEAAHSIKGAAGSLGFDDAHELAKKIEMNARQNILDGSIEDAGAIKEALAVISQAMEGRNHHGVR
jgi:HPt (histidine-containing phosphotransfer) domain-containing protein